MRQRGKQFIDGSEAIARAVALSCPDVISAYPITPQTHIVEHLEKMAGEYYFIQAESEFSAASIALGASAVGARTYTATSSQGLLLMSEVLYNISGLRLPVVITCANRAISGPINIWNDHSDAMAVRDSGWIMLFATDNQESVNIHIAAFKIAESTNFPVMVNVDGFILTHSMEEVSLPSSAKVMSWLGKRKPDKNNVISPDNPIALGMLFGPERYSLYKKEQNKNFTTAKKKIVEIMDKITGKGLIEYTGSKSPKTIIIAMGSVIGTIKHVLAKRKNAGNLGIASIICYRPFPAEEIAAICRRAKRVIILEKVSYPGKFGPLAQDVVSAGVDYKKISGHSIGIGGTDVTSEKINEIIDNKRNI